NTAANKACTRRPSIPRRPKSTPKPQRRQESLNWRPTGSLITLVCGQRLIDPVAALADGSYGATRQLCRVCDHPDELGARDAPLTGERDQVGDLAEDFALFRGADDAGSASGTHLEQPFVAQDPQRPQHGVA